MNAGTYVILAGGHDRGQVSLHCLRLAGVPQLVEDVVVGAGGEHSRLLYPSLGYIHKHLDVLGQGPCPGRNLGKLVSPVQESVQCPQVTLLIYEDLHLLDASCAVVQLVEEVVELEAGFHGEKSEMRVLGPIPHRGIGDEFGVGFIRFGRDNCRLSIQGQGRKLAVVVVVQLLRVDLILRHNTASLRNSEHC